MKLARPKFSPRMQLFIDKAIRHADFWDFCCDHGYVGIGALISEEFETVHFVDQVPHIMERLEILILQSPKYKESLRYVLHSMAGEALELDVSGTCVIAGVGGLTIKTILNNLLLKNKLKAQRLLLSPHSDELVLNEFLQSTAFQMLYRTSEKLTIIESKRERPIYILDKY